MDANNSSGKNPYPDPTSVTGKLDWELDEGITSQIREESAATDDFISALMGRDIPHEMAIKIVRILIESNLRLTRRVTVGQSQNQARTLFGFPPMRLAEKIMGNNVNEQRNEQLTEQEKKGVSAFAVGMFLTGFFVRRYMKKRVPRLERIDLLTEDKILATFSRGNPVVLSRVVER